MAENHQEVTLFAALLGSFVANYVHAIVDFIWWVPACLILLLMQAACACRLYQITRRRRNTDRFEEPVIYFPRFIIWGVSCFVALIAGWMVQQAHGVWMGEQDYQAFQRLALVNTEPTDAMGTPSESLADTFNETTSANSGFSAEQRLAYAQQQLVERVNLLIQAALKNPNDVELRAKVAEGYLIYFELLQSKSDNPMSTQQIRDTVYASGFTSQDEMHEWLKRAFGNNVQFLYAAHQHTLAALRLCPLQGDVYLQYAQLAFLDGAPEEAIESCLSQAQEVRPFDADVLFERGRFEWTRGEYETGLNLWKEAFHQEVRIQKRIIRLVSGPLPPKTVVEFFEPDWLALRRIVQQYRNIQDPEMLNEVLSIYALRAIQEAAREGNDEAVNAWVQAAQAYRELDQLQNAEQCLIAAIKRYPHNYTLHESYAKLLYSMSRMEEAEKELRWCLDYKPDDQALRRRYELVQSKRLRNFSPVQLTSGQEEEANH
ncbi:MAG: hypothetical protein R3C11_09955 [Planctomycetaceae bacterium]